MNFKVYLQDFFNAIKGYSKNLFQERIELVYLLIALVVLYLSYVIVIKVLLKKEKVDWKILFSLVVVPNVLSLIFIGLAVYLWCFTKFFIHQPSQMLFLFIEAFFLLVSLSGLILLSKKFKFKELHKITGLPISEFELSILYSKFIKRFKKLKLWFLLPALGFAILLFSKDDSTLLSLVFDNSGSMQDDLSSQKLTISRALNKVNSTTDVVISYFPVCEQSDCSEIRSELKTDVNEIINETDYENLVGESFTFFSKEEAINFIESDELNISGIGSPLSELIWKSFLGAKAETKNIFYKNRHLIVITDGAGNLLMNDELADFNIFSKTDLSDDMAVDAFFSKITLISLSDNGSNNFFNNAIEYEYYNGSNTDSIRRALFEITKNYKKDWLFIIWLAFIYVIVSTSALFINPKKLY